jgi:hypothetical protein
MEKGDKVECLDNSQNEKSLTVGKVYEVFGYPTYVLSDTVYVTNDKGEVRGYFKKRFKLHVSV